MNVRIVGMQDDRFTFSVHDADIGKVQPMYSGPNDKIGHVHRSLNTATKTGHLNKSPRRATNTHSTAFYTPLHPFLTYKERQ